MNQAKDRLEAEAQRLAASGIDMWDVSAHLESHGVSQAVAEERGHASVFDYADELIGSARGSDITAVARSTHQRRQPVSISAAIVRTLVMMGGVTLCVTSLPRHTSEIAVFSIAAAGWLAGQAVSSVVWSAWGRGAKSDGLRAGLIVGAAVLVLGVAGVAITGVWQALIWIAWGAAIPLLLLAYAGGTIAAISLVVAAVCLVSYYAQRDYPWAPAVLAPVGTPLAAASALVAVALAAVVTVRGAGAMRAGISRGTLVALGVALLQTSAQIIILLIMFMGVGAEAFGAIAMAGLSSGVLAEPLFALVQAWTRRVVATSTDWAAGRRRIGAVSVLVTLVMLVVAALVALVMLSNPYKIFLNTPSIIAAAVLASAVIAATNVLLRTGAPVGAMVFALVAEIMLVVYTLVPNDEPIGFIVISASAAAITGLALVVAWRRFGHPATW